MSDLNAKITDLVRRAAENTFWHQQRCVNLIPSESTASFLVKVMEIADMSGRYADYRYQGINFTRDVEEEARPPPPCHLQAAQGRTGTS